MAQASATDTILDAGSATLSMVDVGLDIAVTKQYWDNAHEEGVFPMFFTLSCTILVISTLTGFFMHFILARPIAEWRKFHDKIVGLCGFDNTAMQCISGFF
eukprot:CAMPEP_0197677906 /NCGR_PEP_ID=MMETSP1338-20131121/89141_1 /TAXON_ID=43686 ORGANISM="Pelagodinium beii, Strain RCC1491" /NCGR_SAMPLE_ID=MMETSP1338 /ASSEMBLY_ACC=CAM_ASM_000754 /LENGTH=100 /DNA_ID=CAMNT_0043258789 /DNA_START=46 /DNA_END=345 /DNA_ORIENTATION=+